MTNTNTFDIEAIEAALIAVGATPEEADALTTILHEEGWGGKEHEPGAFEAPALEAQLDWYREFRAYDSCNDA